MTHMEWQYVKVTWLNTRSKHGGEWDSEVIRGASPERALVNAAKFVGENVKPSDVHMLSIRVLTKKEVKEITQPKNGGE